MGPFPVDFDYKKTTNMSLIIPGTFQHILRVMNTNIDGKRNIMFAITAIKGVGRRYANLVLKKADIDLNKRAGELSEEDVEKNYHHHAKSSSIQDPKLVLEQTKGY